MYKVFRNIFQKYFNKSTMDFYDRMNNGVLKNAPRPIPLSLKESYREYMKAHEGDWYRSQDFLNMFLYCPAEVLGFMTKMYYGDGKVVRDGVNLSDRVVECLKTAFGQFKLEQHTMPKAFVVEAIIKHLGHEVDAGEG